MSFELKNTYGSNTFFVAYIEIDEKRKYRRVLRASDMAELLTDVTLPEHFNTDLRYLKEVKIVQCFHQTKFDAVTDQYDKNLWILSPGELVKDPEVPYKPVVILQCIAFDRFITDAFYVNNTSEAIDEMNNQCNTSIILNALYTRIIKILAVK